MTGTNTAQLWSRDAIVATLEVPTDDSVPDVVVWQGRYFVSPTVGYGAPTVIAYREGLAYVVPQGPEGEQG